jgi:hypothetical protein
MGCVQVDGKRTGELFRLARSETKGNYERKLVALTGSQEKKKRAAKTIYNFHGCGEMVVHRLAASIECDWVARKSWDETDDSPWRTQM